MSKPEQEAFENTKAALCLDSISCHSDPTVELAKQYDAVSLSVGAALLQSAPDGMLQRVA